jgi:hypothetical protein
MPQLNGYRLDEQGTPAAEIFYPKGRHFTPQTDGSIQVETGISRMVSADEAERLAKGDHHGRFFDSVRQGLDSLQSLIDRLSKNGPGKTLRDYFACAGLNLLQKERQPAPVLRVSDFAFRQK